MYLPGPLSALDENQFASMVGLIAMGKGDTEVAKELIKRKWVEGSSEDAVRKAVTKWRKGKGQELAVRTVAEMMTGTGGRLRRQTDVLYELTDLITIQKGRVNKLLKVEEDRKTHMTTTTDEIRVLSGMLSQMGKFQLDAGIIRRVPAGSMADDYAEFEEIDEASIDEFSEDDRRLLLIACEEMGIED